MSALATVNTAVFAVSFGLYTLAIVLVGLYSARYARRSNEDYFLAGRSLGSWVAALSASASSESGWVTLGLVGIAFAHGAEAYWVIPGCLLGYLFNWFVLAGRMNDQARTLQAVTIPDFFAFRYRERVPVLRIISVVVIIVAMLAYVAAQLAASGKAFDAAFGAVDYKWGVLLGAAIVLVYTVTGGFRAVCWTDFLQALLMVGTLIIFPAYLLFNHGGYEFIRQELASVAPQGGQAGDYLRLIPNATGPALIGFLLGSHALGINFGYPGLPHVLVRFMALKDKRSARLAGVIAFVWGLLVYWGAVTVGLFARAMAAQHAAGLEGAVGLEAAAGHWTDAIVADKEVGLVVSAMYLLPSLLSGLVLAAVLAAICSTADSQLVVAASSAANDLWARLGGKGKPGGHPWINRFVVAGLGVLAVLLVFEQRVEVYKYVLNYGWAMLGAAFGPQIILALLWKRSTWAGCVCGMLLGFAAVVIWPHVYTVEVWGKVWPGAFVDGNPVVQVYNLPLGFMLALIVNVIVSLCTRPPKTS